MNNPRQRRNHRRLIASVIVLSIVLICAALIQRNRTLRLNAEQTRYRSLTEERLSPAETQRNPEPVPGRQQAVADAAGTRDGDRPSTAELQTFLEKWRTTLLRGDIPGHVACYAPVMDRYFRQRRVTRAQVMRDKKQMLQLWPDLRRYDISDMRIESSTPGRALVSFRKDWDARSPSRRFAGAERERLTLVPSGNTWQIVSEEELKVYHVSRR